MKILVTGGAGFIGSNLCEYLLLKKYNVICFDNFSTGKMQNIIGLFSQYPSTFKLIVGDVRNISDCINAVRNVDIVFHEAALGSVPRSIEDPVTTNEVNISGFLNMLQASRNAKIKRFIYATSSSIYGNSKSLPKIEDTIGKPLSPYAITKYVNELYADVFSEIFGIETIGLRYFNVFGRRQDPHSTYAAVIPIFAKKLINHESIFINGNGDYSRDFTYIDNVIQMNVLAMMTDNPAAINQVYNTAFGESTTLNQLVNYLKICLSDYDPIIADISINYAPEREGDIPHSLADISKAKTLLDYSPKFSLKDGLREAVKWYWNDLNKI
jgi:UDP-N-acetylglucosamine 4-epimerase